MVVVLRFEYGTFRISFDLRSQAVDDLAEASTVYSKLRVAIVS
jgi:hypothetical protein